MDLIPIGTICYKAGDFLESTKEIIVTKDNQERVTEFWNRLYFSSKNKADNETNLAHAAYNNWQASCMMNGR